VSTFQAVSELRGVVLADGVLARAVNGERMTMAVVDLEPNAIVAEHKHENEQMGFCIKGSITMRIAEEVLELHPGDTYVIPSNVEHGAAAGPDGATIADVFAPIRADWRDKEHLEPAPGHWP
jgi:quercetin dioxygenase-like cupin family protein